MTRHLSDRILVKPDLLMRRSRQLAWYLVHRFTTWDRWFVRRYLSEVRTPKLHIGCEKNILSGWLNTDYSPVFWNTLHLDARRTFRFKDSIFDYIFTEHMIEHISYNHGLQMLYECKRILKPYGRIRVSTPDFCFIMSLYSNNTELKNEYISWATQQFIGLQDVNAVFVINSLMRNWGHTFIYDENTLRDAMRRAGFTGIVKCDLGESDDPELCNLENEARLPAGFLRMETITLEGTKPR
jgi:predicted SAM-dependent methyltransferase